MAIIPIPNTLVKKQQTALNTDFIQQSKARREPLMAASQAGDQSTVNKISQVNQAVRQMPTAPTATQTQGLEQKAGVVIPRTQVLQPSRPTPTPQNPMVPVSPRGGNQITNYGQITAPQPATSVMATPKAPMAFNSTNPSLNTPKPTEYSEYTSMAKTTQDNTQNNSQNQFNVEDYMNASPEQQLMMQNQAAQQQGQMQQQAQKELFDQQNQVLDQREQEAQKELETQKTQLQGQNAEDLNLFKEDQRAQYNEAAANITEAGTERQEQADLSLSFQGFGRSTKAADLRDRIRRDTQSQIADINRQSNRAVNEYEASLIDRMNDKIEKFQDRVDKYQNAKDQVQLEQLKAQNDLTVELFKSNPANPQNMIATAEKLTKIRMEQQKMDMEEKKAVQDRVASNFKYMVDNFGSQFISGLAPEELGNYAAALGVPASVLQKTNKTLSEQKDDWEKLKYFDSQQFDLNKMNLSQQFDIKKIAQQQGFDWEKIQASQDFDIRKMVFGKELDKKFSAGKFDGLGYSSNASASNGASYSYPQPVPTIDGKNMVNEYNPNIAGAKPNGYKFSTAQGGDLAGQCLWYCQQLTTLNGQPWRVGNTIQEKTNSFNKFRAQGNAFKLGEADPQVGNTILTNESAKYGHGMIINGKTPDGKYIVSESNFAGPLTVSNTRIIDPKKDGAKIIGFIKTQPKPQYQVSKTAGGKLETVDNGLNQLRKVLGGLDQNSPNAKNIMKQINYLEGVSNQPQQAPQPQSAPQEQLSPFRQAVRAGTSKLSEAQELEFAQSDPSGFQQYQADKMIGQKSPMKDLQRLPADKVVMLEDAKFLPQTLDNLEKTIQSGKGTFDPIWGKVDNYNPLAWSDTDKQTVNAELRTAAQLIGKYMEGGVLRAEDEVKYRNMLPNNTDTREVALYKLNQIREMLKGKTSGYIQGFDASGYDVKGYMDHLSQLNGNQNKQNDPLSLGFSGGSDPLGLGF